MESDLASWFPSPPQGKNQENRPLRDPQKPNRPWPGPMPWGLAPGIGALLLGLGPCFWVFGPCFSSRSWGQAPNSRGQAPNFWGQAPNLGAKLLTFGAGAFGDLEPCGTQAMWDPGPCGTQGSRLYNDGPTTSHLRCSLPGQMVDLQLVNLRFEA